MASCVRCTLIDKFLEAREPMGVCSVCSSLACSEHGTLLQRADRFKCIFCLPPEFLDSSGMRVIHEVGGEPPDGGGGGGGVDTGAGPGPRDNGPGGSAATPEFLPGEFEAMYEDLAEATREHRTMWRDEVAGIVDNAIAFARDESARKELRDQTTSHPEAVRELERIGAGVSHQLAEARDADLLNEELLADGLGIATWAIGEPLDRPPSAERIWLLSDERVRYFVRYYAPARATA